MLIIGGGLAGSSIALRLSRTSSRQITVLERENPAKQMNDGTAAGSFAAAGMLAPQSERLPTGPLLDLCLESRGMYAEFVAEVEGLAKSTSIATTSGGEGSEHLWRDLPSSEEKMEPWEVGFRSSGGFLAPAFAGDAVESWSPPPGTGSARWLDDVQIREMEPELHPDVVGGWWFPEDASVDARRLTCSLRAACVAAGVRFMTGEGCAAEALELSGGRCNGVRLRDGRIFSANAVVVANGSWMRDLLPVPVAPHKGQSLSLRTDPGSSPLLNRVLFAQDAYVVPKADGRIVIGATVEPGSYDPSVTPRGMMHCLSNALRLVPALADLPIEETWSGLRPTTPDKGPILGKTDWSNLFLAGGYWRNGVLLAPKTGQLLSDLIEGRLSTEDERLLDAFSWDRFTRPGGGKKLAADARRAAELHPVHGRSQGSGVSASVGTELGFYEGAAAAREERERDRSAEEDAFERAARLGLGDAEAFAFGDGRGAAAEGDGGAGAGGGVDDADEYAGIGSSTIGGKDDGGGGGAVPATAAAAAKPFEGSADAYTVGSSSSSSTSSSSSETEGVPSTRAEVNGASAPALEGSTAAVAREEGESAKKNPLDPYPDLNSVYDKIKSNKAASIEARGGTTAMTEPAPDDRPDPKFRIYRVDPKTREKHLVPPYTRPEVMERYLAEGGGKPFAPPTDDVASSFDSEEGIGTDVEEPDETTFDGYQEIFKANARATREEELEAMRRARTKNRLDSSGIDESSIGAIRMED